MAEESKEVEVSLQAPPAQPGQVVTPNGAAQSPVPAPQAVVSAAPVPDSPPEPVVQPQAPVLVPSEAIPPAAPVEANVSDADLETESSLEPEDINVSPAGDVVSWTASEFVAHEKSANWYIGLCAAAAAGSLLVFALTGDFISAGVVIFAAVVFGYFAGHKPRELPYRIEAGGFTIGQKYFSFDDFRSFSVTSEGAFSSIVFMPLKRIAAPISIYYSPDDEEKIIDILSARLPMEEHQQDAVDSLMRRIRF